MTKPTDIPGWAMTAAKEIQSQIIDEGVCDFIARVITDHYARSAASPAAPVGSESFIIRGIGLDHTPGCFVCGGEKKMYNNFAAFVESREAGERCVDMFYRGAWLDFRDYEPNWLQVKVGACDKHLPNLEKLRELVASNEKRITRAIVTSAAPLPPQADAVAKVVELKQAHCKTWRDKPESYWFTSLSEEVGELASALMGEHEHAPEYELKQIAAICLNWLELRAALATLRPDVVEKE